MFKLITLSAVLSAAALVAAGGPEVGITKDCCAAVDQSSRFDEKNKQCLPYTANGMVDCCESRGAGSREESFGADHDMC
ncbi:hypothetical protein E3P99_03912 [Wallemia hederae]|uniref:Uncharacterized protein n=1 Tax=Wallemia hederae TaxID=1540922 RepID=A0A4T0FC79_9BASI|nr:hypothetical protein E3P99_03912 [Wallemia hederae]